MRLWLPQDVLGRREHYGHGVGGQGSWVPVEIEREEETEGGPCACKNQSRKIESANSKPNEWC